MYLWFYMDMGPLDSRAITFTDTKYGFPYNILNNYYSPRNSITKFRPLQEKLPHGTSWRYVLLHHSEQTSSVYHSCAMSRETKPLVGLLPVPSCLEGFWAVLSFEADWLSAQPMSSLRPCTSLYTSIGWRL